MSLLILDILVGVYQITFDQTQKKLKQQFYFFFRFLQWMFLFLL